MKESLLSVVQFVLSPLIYILMHHVAVGYLLHLVHLLEVTHSRADYATHSKENSPG